MEVLKIRPKSRAEREFYGQSNSDFVREFIKEEYDDWDDRYDDVDDYFEHSAWPRLGCIKIGP